MNRPSRFITDDQIRRALLEAQDDLMEHHVEALLPCVRLAIDCEAVGKSAEALGCLYRAAYWSSRRPAVRLFDPDVLTTIRRRVVMPLAQEVHLQLSPVA